MMTDIFFLGPETRMYYYILIFIMLIILILKNRRTIISEYIKISKNTWVLLHLMTLLGLIFRIIFSPMETIKNVSVWSHRNVVLSIYEEQVIASDMQTRGYSLLVSPIYALTKDIVLSAHTFDILIGTLSIIMIFMLTYLLFKDQNAALISALILSFLPWHIFFSGTHGVELTASFFAMLSIILIYLSIKSKEPGIYFLAFISILFTALVRKEQMILLLVFFIHFIITKNPIRIQNKTRIIAYLLVATILFIPFSIDALSGKMREDLLGSDYIIQNIISILEIFSYNFHISLLILAPIALYLIDRKTFNKNRRQIIFLSLWFSIIMIPFLIHQKIYTRYFVFFLLPFIILVSFSLSGLFKTIHRRTISFVLMTGLIFSVIYIYSDCTQDINCKYLTAHPLDKPLTKLSQIHPLLNNTSKKDTVLLFISDDNKLAYITLFGRQDQHIILDVGELCDVINVPSVDQESRDEHKVVNRYSNFNTYVLIFKSDLEEYCDSECFQCINTFKDRKRELYYSGDWYKIYYYEKLKS